jgi:hypothetical protein
MKISLTKFLLLKKSQSFSDKRVRYANFKHKIFLENYNNQSTNDNALDLDTNHNCTTTKNSSTTTTTSRKKALLFLNHGLKRNDITKIKTSLGKYNIKLTKIPVRILSSYKSAATTLNGTKNISGFHIPNEKETLLCTLEDSQNKPLSRVISAQSNERRKKVKMYGEMFLLYATNSSYGNQCLDFLHQQLLYFLLQKQSKSSNSTTKSVRNITYQKLLSNTASNNFPNANIIYNNIFSIETANDILP